MSCLDDNKVIHAGDSEPVKHRKTDDDMDVSNTRSDPAFETRPHRGRLPSHLTDPFPPQRPNDRSYFY